MRYVGSRAMILGGGAAFLLVIASLLSACGSTTNSAAGTTTTTTTTTSTTGTASTASNSSLTALYKTAKSEGSVTWVIGTTSTTFKPIIQAFESKYPGIQVNTITVPTPQTGTRVVTEESAGKVTDDLVNGRFDTLGPIQKAHDIVPITNAAQLGVPKKAILLGGELLSDYDFVNGWEYNTGLVSTSDLPTTWKQVLTSKWSGGKIILSAQGSIGGAETEVINGSWSMSKYEAYVKALAGQKPQVEPNGPVALNALADGHGEIGAVPLVEFAQQVRTGAKVGIAPLGPVVALQSGTFVTKNAPHPAAAKLLSVFLASSAAQPAWNLMGYGYASPCSASYLARALCTAHVKVIDDTQSVNTQLVKLEKVNVQYLNAP